MLPLAHGRLIFWLSYDPEAGAFVWLRSPNRRIRVGSQAGCATKIATLIRVDGVLYGAHRLAWLYMTGDWPTHEIDHWDGNPNNNRWRNLRSATRQQQMWNRVGQCTSKSGVKGVYLNRYGRWIAYIKVNERTVYLGTFATKDQAGDAQRRAAEQHHGKFALSRRPDRN